MKNIIAIAIAVMFAITGIALLNMEPRQSRQTAIVEETQTQAVDQNVIRPAPNPVAPENAAAPIPPDGLFNIADITDDPEEVAIIEEYMTDINLQDSVRSYFDNQENLTDEERRKLARQIETELDRQEAAEKIIPLEALSLRLALLKTNSSDAEYPELARALTEKYQASIAATEPQFDNESADRYKAEEQIILREVQAMSQYPNGMSQSEYLRQRLDELREEIYPSNN